MCVDVCVHVFVHVFVRVFKPTYVSVREVCVREDFYADVRAHVRACTCLCVHAHMRVYVYYVTLKGTLFVFLARCGKGNTYQIKGDDGKQLFYAIEGVYRHNQVHSHLDLLFSGIVLPLHNII